MKKKYYKNPIYLHIVKWTSYEGNSIVYTVFLNAYIFPV